MSLQREREKAPVYCYAPQEKWGDLKNENENPLAINLLYRNVLTQIRAVLRESGYLKIKRYHCEKTPHIKIPPAVRVSWTITTYFITLSICGCCPGTRVPKRKKGRGRVLKCRVGSDARP